ncbi:hypothetical protein BSR75_14275 [Listeria monocytogenes]|nr:hypothetical protein [Listeria monocytogenes]
MKKGLLISIAVILFVFAGAVFYYVTSTDNNEETKTEKTSKKKKATEQEPIEITGEKKSSQETTNNEEVIKEKEVRASNQQLIEAYFTYSSTEEQFQHIYPLVTKEFQAKMEEAAGISESSARSTLVSQESYYNKERFFHPTVVNIITNRVTVNGKSYEQTNYVRFLFTSEDNHWKMNDVTITPIGNTK